MRSATLFSMAPDNARTTRVLAGSLRSPRQRRMGIAARRDPQQRKARGRVEAGVRHVARTATQRTRPSAALRGFLPLVRH